MYRRWRFVPSATPAASSHDQLVHGGRDQLGLWPDDDLHALVVEADHTTGTSTLGGSFIDLGGNLQRQTQARDAGIDVGDVTFATNDAQVGMGQILGFVATGGLNDRRGGGRVGFIPPSPGFSSGRPG